MPDPSIRSMPIENPNEYYVGQLCASMQIASILDFGPQLIPLPNRQWQLERGTRKHGVNGCLQIHHLRMMTAMVAHQERTLIDAVKGNWTR